MKKYFGFFFLLLFPLYIHAETRIGIGDSITTGFGVEKGYFEQICAQKKQENSQNMCENLAVDGLTSTELLLQLNENTLIDKIKQADFIYMSIGGNDFLGDISKNFTVYLTGGVGTAKETGEGLLKNMQKIYERIHLINARVQVYVVPLYNPYFEMLSKNKSVLSIFDSVKKDYMDLSKTFPYVHISPTLGKEIENKKYLNASLTNIDPHPNVLGHTLIAEKIEDFTEISTKKRENYILYFGIGISLSIFFIWFLKKVFTKK